MSKARNLATLLSSDGSVKTTKYVDSDTIGGEATFVASGTLPNGTAVVLKSDGTIETVAVSGSSDIARHNATTEYQIPSTNSYGLDLLIAPAGLNKIVVAYKTPSSLPTGVAIVGTINGTAITWGTPVTFASNTLSGFCLKGDPSVTGSLLVTYYANTPTVYAMAKVLTVTGTSISVGTGVAFNSATTYTFTKNQLTVDPNTAGRFMMAYRDYSGSGNNEAVIIQVSGSSITMGSPATMNPGGNLGCIAFNPHVAGQFMSASKDSSNHTYLKIGSVSGNSITFGSALLITSGSADNIDIKFDPHAANAGRFVMAYKDGPNSNYGTGRVGQITGSSYTIGTPVVYLSASNHQPSIVFDHLTANTLLIRSGNWPNVDKLIPAGLNGTVISYGTIINASDNGSGNNVAHHPQLNNLATYVYAYSSNSGGSIGKVGVGNFAYNTATSNITASNFLGVTTAAYTDGQTATITLQGGTSKNQSGLTPSAIYYVQGDATLGTSAVATAVEVGKALSATSILLKGI